MCATCVEANTGTDEAYQRTDAVVIVDLQRRLERSSIHCSSDHWHTAALLYGQAFFVYIPYVVILLRQRNVLNLVFMVSQNVCFQHAIPKSFCVAVVVFASQSFVYLSHCFCFLGKVFLGASGALGKSTMNSGQGHR